MVYLLQKLYDSCKEAFTSRNLNSSSPELLEHVRSLMDEMTLADLGLDEEFFIKSEYITKFPQAVFYLPICMCQSFSICIFYLPQSSVIQLHDHPDMTVLCKLLFGSIHVKAYDWVDPQGRPQRVGDSNGNLFSYF
ncbi:hypothetical protein KP509_19G002500 [Ceratopteris richardii]|uniref:cysteine dioxygenase n=1 Tax=Ceratopteris richardii TaxID=49495 RepID=A0A8T2SHL4_CERRI|nr:hypothetical protein KP509_19G002500 [Ceratopteris richardii]